MNMNNFVPAKESRGFIMPNFIFEDIELKCGAKVLFSMLCDYARDRNFCYPSLQTLANRLNYSLNTVKAYLQQLEELGYVRIKKSFRGLVYYLFRPRNIDKKVSKIDICKSVSSSNNNKNNQDMSKNDEKLSNFDTEVNVNKLNNLIPPIVPREKATFDEKKEYEKGCGYISFEEFWNVYPKKENYEKAKKAFFYARRKNSLPTLELFKNAIEFFLKDSKWQRENGRFIPQLHNFLNDLRWQEVPKEHFSSNEKNKTAPVAIYTTQDLEELRKREDLQRKKQKDDLEKHAVEQKSIDEAWGDFSKNFQHDKGINLIFAKRYFTKLYKEGGVPKLTEIQSCTALEFLELINLKKRSEKNE